MEELFGPYNHWPAQWKRTSREAVLELIGQLEDRLVKPYLATPYDILVPLCDPDASHTTKLACVKKLVDAREEELHSSLRKIRNRVAQAPEELCSPYWQNFLFKAVNMIPLSSACVEILFGQYKQWLGLTPKPPSLTLIQSKHFVATLSRAAAAKRRRAGRDSVGGDLRAKRKYAKRCRPAWVMKVGDGARRNGFHEFVGNSVRHRPLGTSSNEAFKKAAQMYGLASRDAKAKSKIRAQTRNKKTTMSKLHSMQDVNSIVDDAASPWNISAGSVHVLHPDVIQAELLGTVGGVLSNAKRWYDRGSRVGPALDFPSNVPYSVFFASADPRSCKGINRSHERDGGGAESYPRASWCSH
jgi:hypothetical protein